MAIWKKTALALYFGFILLGAADMAADSYCFMEGKSYHSPRWAYVILHHPVACYTGRYTGLESGYGYFAPNVRSAFFVDVLIDSQVYRPQFASLNGYLRYEAAISQIFSDLYEPGSSKRMTQLVRKLDNLKLINIAEFTALSNRINNATHISMECYVLVANSLYEYRRHVSPKKLLIKKINFK